jgi:hypothetical protein
LIAADGSTLNLPSSEAIKEEFGVYSSTKGGTNTYLAKVLFLYDVLDNYVLDGHLSCIKDGEITLLKKALKTEIPDNSIIILDRGYGYMSTVLELANQGLDFAVRFSTSTSSFAKQMMESEHDDQIITWIPTKKEKEKARERGQTLHPLQVRVTRISLSSGETELIVSSLIDMDKYPISDISELYHYRWPIEEGFKYLKPKMKIEQFGARKPEGILQEFYAHIFLMNLVALFGQIADRQIKQKTSRLKYQYKYNWKTAFLTIRDKLHELLKAINVKPIFDWIINSMIKFKVVIKPNRSFIREPRSLNKSRKINAYYK